LPVKYAKRIRNRETLEGQCLADLSRAYRAARLLDKSRLWEGRCCVRSNCRQIAAGSAKLFLEDRTVFQCSNHCDERGVKRISVIVDARRVDVEDPGCTPGMDT
jgi:hypothetical protein